MGTSIAFGVEQRSNTWEISGWRGVYPGHPVLVAVCRVMHGASR
jgi:hypothetical protein